MENTSFRITDRQAYFALSNLRKCIAHRNSCDYVCSECKFDFSSDYVIAVIDHLQHILKSRCPELLIMEDLEEICNAIDQKQ